MERVDKASILIGGKHRSVGSPAHLRAKFAAGFLLEVAVGSADQMAELDEFVLREFPGAEIDERFELRAAFRVPHVTHFLIF